MRGFRWVVAAAAAALMAACGGTGAGPEAENKQGPAAEVCRA